MKFRLAAITLLLLAGSANADQTYSAKSLFFGENDSVIAVSTAQKDPEKLPVSTSATLPDTKAPATPVAAKKPSANIGASYFVRLKNPDGSTRNVLSSRKFRSGERFQLGVKVNRPSYIYILNEDSKGKITPLYPQPGKSNFFDAMGTVFLPAEGAFEFDHEPGIEQLLVYVSQKPLKGDVPSRINKQRPDIVTGTPNSATTLASLNCGAPSSSQHIALAGGQELASKGIQFSEKSACSPGTAQNDLYASKGISFSDDEDSASPQLASYVVKKAPRPDTSLYLKIKLDHQ